MAIKKCKSRLSVNTDGSEAKTRGTPMFPCGAYCSDMTDPMMNEIPWHWHDEMEALVVVEGCMLVYMNDDRHPLRKGEGIFVNSSVLHSAEIEPGQKCTFNSLVFHPRLLSGGMESVFEQNYIRPLATGGSPAAVVFQSGAKWSRQAAQCIRDAYRAYDAGSYGYELLVRERLSHMLYLMLANTKPELGHRSGESADAIRAKAMLAYLHNNFTDKIALSHIAASANISERECLRCFGKVIGQPPMRYLLRYRIQVSARLLADTDLPVTEICFQTGFENTSYFSKIFKRFLSCTPTAYREKSRRRG